MKKCLICFTLILALLVTGAQAAYEPDPTPIMVDGVRTGFFAPDGSYLPALCVNDLTYVPLEAFAQSVSLSVVTDGQFITTNGIRIAMFADSGSLLSPMDVDGTVYVPLIAFAKSVGLSVKSGEAGISISRSAAAAAPAQQTAPEHPEFLELELTESNFGKYFSYRVDIQNFDHGSKQYRVAGGTLTEQNYQGDYVLTVTAKTSYPFRDVTIGLEAYAKTDLYETAPPSASFYGVTVPPSGTVSASRTFEKIYFSYADYVYSASHLHPGTRDLRVKGSISIPWQEYCADKYVTAEAGDPQTALPVWQELAAQNYKDSAERMSSLMEQQYQGALQAFADADYDRAIACFTLLQEYAYKDAAQQLDLCQNAKWQREYDRAADLEAKGSFLTAQTAFEALGDFSDAAARAQASAQAYFDAYDSDYQAAKTLMRDKQYADAIAAFGKLNGYLDSKEQIAECKRLETFEEAKALEAAEYYENAIAVYESLDAQSDIERCQNAIPARNYRRAMEQYESGDFDAAQEAFLALGEYQDAAAMADKCPVEKQYVQAMAAYNRQEYKTAYALFTYQYADERVKPLLILDAEMSERQLAALLRKGNVVWFGNEPWFVIDNDNGQTMLLSVSGIDAQPFDLGKKATWKNSSLREWLNSTFLTSTFSEEEQALIATVSIKNEKWDRYAKKTKSDSATKDKAFLLSRQEVLALPSKMIDTMKAQWWLRTKFLSKYQDNYIVFCWPNGELDGCFSHSTIIVRPALWVKLGYKTLKSGSKGPSVQALEETLARCGWFTDEPNEKYDKETATAVKLAQEQFGLEKSGQADWAFRYQLDDYAQTLTAD